MLIENGKLGVNMDTEGWTTTKATKTQTARFDFTYMHSPKIAVGITKKTNQRVL